MTDTFQQLYGIQRQSHASASPVQSDGKPFRPSDAADKVTAALDGYGKQMAATDKLLSGKDAPDPLTAKGQVALNDASQKAVAAALTTAQQADQAKMEANSKSQSSNRVYAQRQASADKALTDNLTSTTKLAASALLPTSTSQQTPQQETGSGSKQTNNSDQQVSLDSQDAQSSLGLLSTELRHLKPREDPDLVKEMNDLSGAAEPEDLW
ncbi:hypothetical protein ACTL6U_05870 [Rhodovibrionaceae bacterium A322]